MNTCLEVNDEEKLLVMKKEREGGYDKLVMLSWSKLMAAKIKETASNTNSSPVTRPPLCSGTTEQQID